MARGDPREGANRRGAGCCHFLRGGQPPSCPVPALAPGGDWGGLAPRVGGGDLVWVTTAVQGQWQGEGSSLATGFPKEGLSPSPLPSPREASLVPGAGRAAFLSNQIWGLATPCPRPPVPPPAPSLPQASDPGR